MGQKLGMGFLLLSFLVLGGCTYYGHESLSAHYLGLDVPQPRGASFTYCHGYGCHFKSRFRLTQADMASLRGFFPSSSAGTSGEGERLAIAKAVAWFEQRAGRKFGTSVDRPRTDMKGMGDPTQLDCVDEATNSLSLLVILHAHGLLQHHEVKHPVARNNGPTSPNAWLHYGTLLVEKETGKKFIVDSWPFSNGSRPAIVRLEHWYNAKQAFRPQPFQRAQTP